MGNFAGQTRTRLTVSNEGGQYPTWTPGGDRIAYGESLQGRSQRIAWKAANSTGSPEELADRLREGNLGSHPYFFTLDGAGLVFREQSNPNTGDNIGLFALENGAETTWLLNTMFNERNAELSPDGRWMAYQSDESGQWEIYVRPFPNVDDDRIPVSNAGGVKPLWSRDGSELFDLEVGIPTRLMAATVDGNGPDFSVDGRTALLGWPYRGVVNPGRTYDVSLDRQRFLAIREGGTDGDADQPQVIVVQNFFTELERLGPTE